MNSKTLNVFVYDPEKEKNSTNFKPIKCIAPRYTLDTFQGGYFEI
jgi:hypothetical protein